MTGPGTAPVPGGGQGQPVSSLREAVGRPVMSRASAENLGRVGHLVVDVANRTVRALVVGSGKKAQVVDWSALTGFGPDAVMVGDEASLRAPAGELEEAVAAGKRELVGARALSTEGVALGAVTDADLDPASGRLLQLRVGDMRFDAAHLLGLGSYAAVLQTSPD